MTSTVVNSSGQISFHSAYFRPLARITRSVVGSSTKLTFTNQEKHKENTTKALYATHFNRLKPMKLIHTRRRILVFSSPEDLEIEMERPYSAAARMIKKFYLCINEKKLKQLDQYIADDCYLEDCSFPYAVEGQEVKQFYHQLATSMGQNVKFCIEHVCHDDGSIVGINWHLEWKDTPIPFTRGCSFYECLQKENKVVIKKARVVTESPIKPGSIVLNLLKSVTSIFDDFPQAAEWFLKRPYVLEQFLMAIYAGLLAPIINPLLAGYFKMWDFIARLFALGLRTLHYILKNYFG